MAAGVIPLIGGALSAGIGLFQRGAANKWLKHNQYPIEGMPREYLANQGMAENMANTGLPQEQYNNSMKNIQRQQMIALRGAADRRGGLSALAGLTTATNDAIGNLDARDAAARQQNQLNLQTVNNQVAGVKRDLFQKNTRDKYNRDFDYNMNLLGTGNQNISGGLDKVATGALGLFGGKRRSTGLTRSGQPTYYNGYNQNSEYGDFQNPYE